MSVDAPRAPRRRGAHDRGVDHRTGFWVAFVVGSAVMAWGAWLFVESTSPGDLLALVAAVVVSDLLVDWLVLPVVVLAGWLVSRYLPPWLRAPAQVALMATGAVLLVGWLPLRGSARSVGNPTIQPVDYGPAIAVTLAVVWSVAGVWAAWRRWSSRA